MLYLFKSLILVFFLLISLKSAFANNGVSAIINGTLVRAQADKCYEVLTCEDKIILSSLSADITHFNSSRAALTFIDQKINSLPEAQQTRLKIALAASFAKKTFELSPEAKEIVAEAFNKSQVLNVHLNQYLTAVRTFYETIEKIKDNPKSSYLIYSLADRSNWQGKLLNLFVSVPNFNETPLGVSLSFVNDSRTGLIQEFLHYMDEIGLNETDKEFYETLLRHQLQQQYNEIENQVTLAEAAVLGSANVIKKNYQIVLSATIIAATMGTAGPVMFGLNGAGLYLAADSTVDLAESYFNAYGEGGSGDFYCAYSQNNLKNYQLSNVFSKAAVAGGMAFVLGGVFNTVLKSSSSLVRKAGIALAAGAVSYAGYATIGEPARQVIEIEGVKIAAMEAGDTELAQCLGVAQKKVISGGAINLSALLLSLRGIGEADFSRLKSPNLKHYRLNEILINHSHKLRGLNRSVVDNGAVKVVKISGVDGVDTRVHYSNTPSKLDGVRYKNGLVNTQYILRQKSTVQVDRAIENLTVRLDDRWPSFRDYEVPRFDGEENGRIVEKMYEELIVQFQSKDFIINNFRRLLGEYEHFSATQATSQRSSFLDSWKEFMRYIGKHEDFEIQVLENRFYPSDEFRSLVGRKILFDRAFVGKSHGLTTHGVQVIFITRHFRELGIPDKHIDEFFLSLSDDMQDPWGRLFDGFSSNFTSPENVNTIFRSMRFHDQRSGI